MIKLLSFFFLLFTSFSLCASPVPVEHFAKVPEYHDVVISPSGEYLAVQREAEEDKQFVAVVRTKDLKLMSHIPATGGVSPYNPVWINDERLVVQYSQELSSYEQESANGELFSMNFNGKKKRKIIEHQRAVTVGKQSFLNNLHGWARVNHLLPDEEDYVLIEFWEFTRKRSTNVKPKIYKIHATRGKVSLITQAPSYNAYFTFSPKGEVKYSVGIGKEGIKKTNNWVVHKFNGKQWEKLNDLNFDTDSVKIVAVTSNPEEVYVWAEYDDKPDKIYRYNMETGDKKLVFYHPKVDPRSLDIDKETGELIAVHYEPDYPNIHIVDENHVYSKWYPALYQAFNGKGVRITSATNDQSMLVVYVFGANEPGQFHLFNTQTKKLKYLFNSASWIDTKALAEVKPISFKARDGLEIHGYLTKPNNAKGKVPLVVIPHGGPHGPRDFWRYDSEVQFLASRGYAVLQVNFRGSGGYGLGFEESGYLKWGTDIQYDIIDGTKWAANLDSVDGERICIMGASFGGYSALMSPTIESNLYKCAVGFVGIYDLELMWTTANTEKTRIGENFLREIIGEDKEEMKKNSPLHNIDKLKAPVFLVHGKKDWLVDEKHFHVMKKALTEKGHPLETMLVKKEGHGFANEKNRVEYLKRVETFLAKYIGEKI